MITVSVISSFQWFSTSIDRQRTMVLSTANQPVIRIGTTPMMMQIWIQVARFASFRPTRTMSPARC